MVNQDLLEIIRCPRHTWTPDDSPGPLKLVRDCWLVCPDCGCKYPIIDDIPQLLIEVGEKYKDMRVEDLPVPPPAET